MKKQPYQIKYLDYVIRNTWNSDGYVLFKPGVLPGPMFYQTHLGNYSKPEDAKRAAVVHFMIKRPEHFHASLASRLLYGSQIYWEYATMEKACKEAKVQIPEELGHCGTSNRVLTFKGKIL